MVDIDHTNTPTQHLHTEATSETCQAVEIVIESDEVLYDFCEENYLLGESLELFERYRDETLPMQHETLTTIIASDAQQLSGALLNNATLEKPLLTDIFLLIRAYDITADATTRASLEYIFTYTPPTASEPIAHAFYRAVKQGIPVLPEYLRISQQINTNIEMIDLQREASDKQQAELAKEINRREADQQQRTRQARKLPQHARPILIR